MIKQVTHVYPSDAIHAQVDSPLGVLRLIVSDDGVHRICWPHEESGGMPRFVRDPKHPIVCATILQLKEYFERKRTAFDLPLSPIGTPFQLEAWAVLRGIPYGQTISYAEQARRLGDVRKARAVGMANGRNPLSILVPCHRVIGSNGQLTGFGGGLDNKAFLLGLEAKHSKRSA